MIVINSTPEFFNRLDELLLSNDDIVIKGDLNCNGIKIKELPKNLTVDGWFFCNDNGLTHLPYNLTVTGNLYCFNNQLTSLPEKLTVDGSFNCSNNKISYLPDSLRVGCDLNCTRNNIVYEIKAKIGSIIMDEEQIFIYNRAIKLRKITDKIKSTKKTESSCM